MLSRPAGQWGRALYRLWGNLGGRNDGEGSSACGAAGSGGSGVVGPPRRSASAGRSLGSLETRPGGGTLWGAASAETVRHGGPGKSLGGRGVGASLEPSAGAGARDRAGSNSTCRVEV